MILGIDEVGRGPWAGPLVVGAVVLGGVVIDGLTDSKKLSGKKRQELDVIIREHALGFGLGWVDAGTIDKIGLSESLRLATKLAVEQIKVPYHQIIIDGTINFLSQTTKGKYVKTIKKADELIPSVSAASIIAKVARDNFMTQQDELYAGYSFKKHVGYGTSGHKLEIKKFGITPLHRMSFAPLKNHITDKDLSANNIAMIKSSLNTKEIGDKGEKKVIEYLKSMGHRIINHNWKTKYCEIDIISLKDNTIFFNEVKYRNSVNQGGGIAAITPNKIRQMRFAAEYYVSVNKLYNSDLRLMAVSVSGKQPVVDSYLEIV